MEILADLVVGTLVWLYLVLCVEVCGPAIRSWFEGGDEWQSGK